MAEQILGTDFEIHGGGSDLVFPHHENEIAQTEAARGEPLARIWMHNGMVRMGEEKMAKSVGNIRLLHAGARRVRPRRARHVLRRAATTASRSRSRPRRSRRRAGGRPAAGAVPAARPGRGPPGGPGRATRSASSTRLADDFNTPAALSVLFEWVTEANRRLDAGERLGPGRLPEMLHALGLENLLGGVDEDADAGGASNCSSEREAARAAKRLRPRRQPARRAGRARLRGARHAGGRAARALGVIVYGRNPVREALRGRRDGPSGLGHRGGRQRGGVAG